MKTLIIIISLLLGGCSTITTLAAGVSENHLVCDDKFTTTRIYSGISADYRFLAGNYQEKGLIFWDLPFSLVADTIVLPYTIYAQVRYGNLCNKKPSAAAEPPPTSPTP